MLFLVFGYSLLLKWFGSKVFTRTVDCNSLWVCRRETWKANRAVTCNIRNSDDAVVDCCYLFVSLKGAILAKADNRKALSTPSSLYK